MTEKSKPAKARQSSRGKPKAKSKSKGKSGKSVSNDTSCQGEGNVEASSTSQDKAQDPASPFPRLATDGESQGSPKNIMLEEDDFDGPIEASDEAPPEVREVDASEKDGKVQKSHASKAKELAAKGGAWIKKTIIGSPGETGGRLRPTFTGRATVRSSTNSEMFSCFERDVKSAGPSRQEVEAMLYSAQRARKAGMVGYGSQLEPRPGPGPAASGLTE
eukprot:TRINITY_DN14081_c0_g2_i1.p1 TRINITY_DN14081_c0_g2~~TRINITY_DN14081_c0_g2_i1.p1  ORF type:complete len:218 (-),score=40.52 TRINITY_DN14081_c0_g2_i1:278-931(-)